MLKGYAPLLFIKGESETENIATEMAQVSVSPDFNPADGINPN